MTLQMPPSSADFSGTWRFISQDENAYQDFKRRAQFASTRALTDLTKPSKQQQQRSRRTSDALPNHILLDMLVSLVSLPIDELYIKQTASTFAIDYGVAGYHQFKLAKENELLIGGAELKSTAGWEDGQMLIQMVVTERFQIIQKFRQMDKNNLVETLEVTLGNEQKISHQRWYQRN